MLCNYPPLRYSQDSHTITILLLLPSTFAVFPLFTRKVRTTAPIEEAPMEKFYTWTFGPDEIIDLCPISFDTMKVAFFSVSGYWIPPAAGVQPTRTMKADSQ